MTPLTTGLDLVSAREQLNLTQRQLADIFEMGISTLRRYETSEELSPLVALAAECLLRRQKVNGKERSPEEIAARQVAIAEARARLRAAAGMHTQRYQPLTPEEKARRRLETQQAYDRLRAEQGLSDVTQKATKRLAADKERSRLRRIESRNRHRDIERPLIAALHAKVKPLALAGEWDAYHRALQAHAVGEGPADNQLRYIGEATKILVPDDSPLILLPLEAVQ